MVAATRNFREFSFLSVLSDPSPVAYCQFWTQFGHSRKREPFGWDSFELVVYFDRISATKPFFDPRKTRLDHKVIEATA